jgi:hypothetical protein
VVTSWAQHQGSGQGVARLGSAQLVVQRSELLRACMHHCVAGALGWKFASVNDVLDTDVQVTFLIHSALPLMACQHACQIGIAIVYKVILVAVLLHLAITGVLADIFAAPRFIPSTSLNKGMIRHSWARMQCHSHKLTSYGTRLC